MKLLLRLLADLIFAVWPFLLITGGYTATIVAVWPYWGLALDDKILVTVGLGLVSALAGALMTDFWLSTLAGVVHDHIETRRLEIEAEKQARKGNDALLRPAQKGE